MLVVDSSAVLGALAYDATFVALTEGLDAPLVTCDARLHAAPGHRARVELFSER